MVYSLNGIRSANSDFVWDSDLLSICSCCFFKNFPGQIQVFCVSFLFFFNMKFCSPQRVLLHRTGIAWIWSHFLHIRALIKFELKRFCRRSSKKNKENRFLFYSALPQAMFGKLKCLETVSLHGLGLTVLFLYYWACSQDVNCDKSRTVCEKTTTDDSNVVEATWFCYAAFLFV